MSAPNLIPIGRVLKTFGYRGEIIAEIFSEDPWPYKDLTSVFLEIQGTRIPFFIESLAIRPDQTLRLKLRQINTPEEAARILQCRVFGPPPPVQQDDEISYDALIGFRITDVRYGEIGILQRILEHGEQDVMVVDAAGTEVLIPLVEEFIVEVDVDGRRIDLETPEGLIELYLHPDAG